MKTGIFIDIDGTLTNDQKEISAYDQEVIKKLDERSDINIYLITGKSFDNALPYYKKLNLNTKLITSAGQVICNPHNASERENIYTNSHELKKLIKYIKELDTLTNFLIEGDNSQYFMMKVEKSNLASLIAGESKIMSYTDNCISEIIGAYLEIKHMGEQELLGLTKELKEKFIEFDIAYWLTKGHHPVLQIKPSNIGKSIALKKVIESDKLDKTISFGNGWIDVHMLKVSDQGYAMLNSTSKVKESADYVTKADNNNSGVGKELNAIFQLNI